jgi:hypothetical protein
VQASASANMRCLYSALNRRRSAFGMTCGSGGASVSVWAWVPLERDDDSIREAWPFSWDYSTLNSQAALSHAL